jgi:antirestriction protein ArdC
MAEQRADVYARITDEIVAAIEAGVGKWKMPWHHDGSATSRPINLASNKPYRGISVLALWAVAERFGYTKGLWGTYRQWQAEGAQVRKGRACLREWAIVEHHPLERDHHAHRPAAAQHRSAEEKSARSVHPRHQLVTGFRLT